MIVAEQRTPVHVAAVSYGDTLVTVQVHTPDEGDAHKNQYVFCGNDPVNNRDPFGLCEDDQGFWGLSGNAINNTVTAVNYSLGQGLHDLFTWQWSGNQWNQISGLMWSTDTPAVPGATPYISTALGVSGAAAITAGALIGLEAAGISEIGSANVGWKGGELTFTRPGAPTPDWRFNPLGGSGRGPHYHRRGPGGIGRHRPWDPGPGRF